MSDIAGVVVTYLTAWIARRATAAGDRIGEEVDDVASSALDRLCSSVKERLGGRRSGAKAIARLEEDPESDDAVAAVEDSVLDELESDPALLDEWAYLVKVVERADPTGVLLTGSARAGRLRGRQAGALVEGALGGRASVHGTATADVVEEGGESVGLIFRPGTPSGRQNPDGSSRAT